jgi:uncharacterized membrane protein YoaK (UPF0700 family)
MGRPKPEPNAHFTFGSGFFLVGGFVSAVFIQVPAFHGRDSSRYILPFWAVTCLVLLASLIPSGAMPREALIMLSVPFRSEYFGLEPATLTLLSILALACGIQNNLFLVERNLVFRTTHLTGTTSDLATHLVRILFRLHLNPETRQFEIRLAWLRALSLLSFLCGAAAGFVAHTKLGRTALLFPLFTSAALAIYVTIYFYLRSQRTGRRQGSMNAGQAALNEKGKE